MNNPEESIRMNMEVADELERNLTVVRPQVYDKNSLRRYKVVEQGSVRYKTKETDGSIAKKLGVTISRVENVRRAVYGQILHEHRSNSTIGKDKEELNALSTRMSRLETYMSSRLDDLFDLIKKEHELRYEEKDKEEDHEPRPTAGLHDRGQT